MQRYYYPAARGLSSRSSSTTTTTTIFGCQLRRCSLLQQARCINSSSTSYGWWVDVAQHRRPRQHLQQNQQHLPAIIITGSNFHRPTTIMNQQIQIRSFSSRNKEYYKLRKKKKEEDPFLTLGIEQPKKKVGVGKGGGDDDGEVVEEDGVTYAYVKQMFLQIAMKHHPDTTKAETEEEKDEHREIFVAARRAFEMICEGPNGIAMLRSDNEEDSWEEDELDAWFRGETGHDMPFMDMATMKEVAEMTDTMGGDSGGLDRDGGMWTLARMVTENVKKGGDGAAGLLQLEAGDIRDRKIDGVLRRRRRR